jgi:hypothetical protein
LSLIETRNALAAIFLLRNLVNFKASLQLFEKLKKHDSTQSAALAIFDWL